MGPTEEHIWNIFGEGGERRTRRYDGTTAWDFVLSPIKPLV